MKHFLFVLVIIFLTALQSYALNSRLHQNKQIPVIKTSQQIQIENELSRLKHEDNSTNLSRIIELNRQLEILTGQNVTAISPQTGEQFQLVNRPVEFSGNTDFIQNTLIHTNPASIVAIAVAVEQRGTSAGKIWAVVVYSAGASSPDSMAVLYSVNNGLSWIMFVPGNIRPLDKINYDDLDMELVENVTGQKYLWVVFGYRKSGGTGDWKTGGFALQVPSLNGTFFNELSWPGSDTTKRYYNIRITSDNARYAATPFLFIVCSFDSLDGSGNRVNTQKLARNLTPYSIGSISFSYMGPKYYWHDASGPAGYQRELFTDIAYFNNGGSDSLEVSYNGVPDSTKVFFAKSDIIGNPPVISAGITGGSGPNDFKTHAKISSNGNDNGSVICVFNQYTSGNRYVKWFRSNNFGNFSAAYNESVLWGSAVNTNYQPSIIGVRNGNTHYIAFETSAGVLDSVHYISVTSTGAENHIQKMNYFTNVSEQVGPKALFRYAGGDSCLVFYTEQSPVKFYSASGCSGEPIGINNNQKTEDFSLAQNYPNPFNPKTTIRFSVGTNRDNSVKLVIYDLLGREVQTIVNSNLSSGSYELEWDGSNFASGVYYYRLDVTDTERSRSISADIKKMVLMK